MFRNTIYIYRYYWGLEISHQCSVISILPNKLTFGNSALYPESVFICFILISKMKEKLVGCSHAELPMTKWSNVSAYYGKTEVRSHNDSPTPLKRMSITCLLNGKAAFDYTTQFIDIHYIYMYVYMQMVVSEFTYLVLTWQKEYFIALRIIRAN